VTVLTESSSRSFNGNDVATAFATGFRFLDNAHLTVRRTTAGVTSTLVEGVGYSVTGAGDVDGGTVTLLLGALATGATLDIERNTPILQEVALRSQGTFLPAVHEEMFDRLTLIAQENRRRIAALEALGGLTDISSADFTFASKDFTTDASDIEDGFPFNIAVVGGENATDAWCTRLQNRDDELEVFDVPPSIQWAPGAGDNVSIKRISGLKPGTNYRIRIGVKLP